MYEGGSFVPSAKIIGNEKFSIINDYIGRPIQVYNEIGNLVWETDHDIYGDLRNLRGDRDFIPFRQLGQYEDAETSLYYNRFRYYNPESGLYLSQDPIGLAGNNPNFYGYVFDSNSQVDVFGLECWNTARKKFWKAEAIKNPHLYSTRNIARMTDGKAPKMRVEIFHHKSGTFKTKDVSMELHHTSLTQRGAGEVAHESWNLTKAAPWGHESMDTFRHTGSDLIKIVRGTNSW